MSSPGACLRWRGTGGEVECVLALRGECGIFHGESAELELGGLPEEWVVGGVAYCAAALPCGHTFHVSALAMHFLLGDMRCPMCRVGPPGAMTTRCLPDSVRALFEARVREAQERASNSDEEIDTGSGEDVEISSDEQAETSSPVTSMFSDTGMLWVSRSHCERFQADLRLEVELHDPTCAYVMVFSTPVKVPDLFCNGLDVCHECNVPDVCIHNKLYNLTLQRSFHRHVFGKLHRLSPMCLARFTLSHPGLQYAVNTPDFRVLDSAVQPLLQSFDRSMSTHNQVGEVTVQPDTMSICVALDLQYLMLLF